MKRCPQCMRDYTDGSLNFCLDDGVVLLDGPAIVEEPATVVLGAFGAPSSGIGVEGRTQVFTNTPLEARTLNANENENSIAVLSFKNISADAENEYFCDGLAEELLNA